MPIGGHGGPPPKPPGQKARPNKDPIPLRIVQMEIAPQPELPSFDVQVTENGEVITKEFYWPDRTRAWWNMWGESGLSDTFTENDWSELLDTALLHAKYWSGSLGLAAELRQRAAKFGATPEDRARLRIQIADADYRDERAEARKNAPSSRSRYQNPPKAV